MKSKLLIWILLLFSFGYLEVLASIDYGLHFKSHSVPGNERTSLSLDENVPFHIKNEFIIDFQMWVRNEPDFGAILHLCTNENNFFILYLQQVIIIGIFQLLYSMKGCLLLIPI